MNISELGINLEKHYESLHDGDMHVIGLQPKMDPVGIWTIGWGHAIVYKGKFLKGKENKKIAYSIYPSMTMQQAVEWLIKDNTSKEIQINRLGLKLNQGQFDTLTDFVFNLGFGRLLTSTLLKKIRANASSEEIAAEFMKWDKASGKALPGLTARCKSRATLYNTGKLVFYN